MLDHFFVSVSDLDRSIAFYEKALAPLGIRHAIDYDGANGPEGHPDLKGFGRDGRVFLWLRHGSADARAVHVGFVAKNEAEVNAFYAAAIAAGGHGQRQAGRAPLLRSGATTLPMFSTPMATASRWCTRAGSIRSPSCLAYIYRITHLRDDRRAAFWGNNL
jgi:catechol 2,3-dioxygenase-like lactoylglutathione lyase family enzyme